MGSHCCYSWLSAGFLLAFVGFATEAVLLHEDRVTATPDMLTVHAGLLSTLSLLVSALFCGLQRRQRLAQRREALLAQVYPAIGG